VFPSLTSGTTGDPQPAVLVIDSYAMHFVEGADPS
jgi:acyl-coenzyme A synthetase/AMP-(fatty) acid ligase